MLIEEIILAAIGEISSRCFTTKDVIDALKVKYPETYRQIIRKYGYSGYSFRCYVAATLRALVVKGILVRGESVCKGKRGFRKTPKGIGWSSPCIAEWCKVQMSILDYLH